MLPENADPNKLAFITISEQGRAIEQILYDGVVLHSGKPHKIAKIREQIIMELICRLHSSLEFIGSLVIPLPDEPPF